MNTQELIISVGENIKRIRISKGISQAQLAKSAQVTPSILSNIESGKTLGTPLSTFNRVANGLGVGLSELIK